VLSLFHDETHEALREAIAGWVKAEIAPNAYAWEEANGFPRDLYRSAGAAGITGVSYPEAYGGGGGDVFHHLIATEELVRGGSVGTAVGLGSHAIAVPPIVKLGSEAQKQRWLPGVCSGELVAALAVSEPAAGSDVANVQCKAVRDGDHYVLNGQKTFITSGSVADIVTTAVRTGDPGYGGITLLVVETNAPGFSVGRKLDKMGWWASDTAELHFEDCRVPVANRLGAENMGFFGIMANFVDERLMLAATCVAIMRLAIEQTEAYIAQREAFGRPIARFQVVRHRMAEMVTKESAARSYTATVAARHHAGEDVTGEVAMLKNHCTQACMWVTDQAVQLHGGYGYMREYMVERLFRDARLFPIGGGTEEIMREIIAKQRGW